MLMLSTQNKKRLAIGLLSIAALLILDRSVDHRHLFWRPLDPSARQGAATYLKLLSLNFLPDSQCDKLLPSASGLGFQPLQQRRTAEGCGWDSAVKLQHSDGIAITNGGIELRCPMSLGVHIWLRELDLIANQQFGSGLKRIHHAGSYNCRRINHARRGEWSQHAYANAWDVLGFELDNGRMISVLKDWHGDSGGQFLRAARDQACGIFGVVLGPDYNSAHRDHFHLDLGFGDACS